MIKAVIFDWGGVLVKNLSPELIPYVAGSLNVTEEDIWRAWEKYETPFQEGAVTEEEFLLGVCNDLHVSLPSTTLWSDGLRAAYHEHPEMFELIRELRLRGLKIGFLSNTEEPAVSIFRERMYDELFDVAVFSCFERLRKPDSRIYEAALMRLNVLPEQAVFLDDRSENVEAAQRLGMKTVHVVTPQQAIADLKKML